MSMNDKRSMTDADGEFKPKGFLIADESLTSTDNWRISNLSIISQ